MIKDITFNGKNIDMEGWAHQKNINPNLIKNPNLYRMWIQEQTKLYPSSNEELINEMQAIARTMNVPLLQSESLGNIAEIESFSASPILNALKNYHYSDQTNIKKNSTLLYLGAGNDFEHASLFVPNTSILVDQATYYKNAAEEAAPQFRNLGYNAKVTRQNMYNLLTLEHNGLEKRFIFINEDIKNKSKVLDLISKNKINSIDFLIQKKTNNNPEHAFNYFEYLNKSGLFLYSDISVCKELPGFTELWHGVLGAKRLQDGGDSENYPAKLFRKD
jgi:hypothetical protein